MRSWSIAWGAIVLLVACGDAPPPPTSSRRDAGPAAECRGVLVGQLVCEGTSAILCDEAGQVSSRTECGDSAQICVSGRGCVVCAPGTLRCDGETVLRCNADGTAETRAETCDAASGLRCSPAGCARLCEQAETERSYLGCEYLAVPTTNTELDSSFEFAVAIANPQLVPAVVSISRGESFAQTIVVPPTSLELVRLPWIDSLRRPVARTPAGELSYFSVREPEGSYRIRADVPITVHQFNPLSFVVRNECVDGLDGAPEDGRCNSYTNDASLLLPVHALTGSYLVMSRSAHYFVVSGRAGASPGFVAIANADEVPATITVRARAYVLASADGSIAAQSPGDDLTLTLAPGEVAQLLGGVPDECPSTLEPDPRAAGVSYCPVGADYDLTGTEIVSNQRLAVFSGHNCTFVPYDRWACDHLEEQVFPAEALGTSVVSPIGYQYRGEPALLRVVSSVDDNTITFSPPPAIGPETTVLGRGDHVEVTIEVPTRVTGTGPILAARFLVGQDYAGGPGSSGAAAPGDPAMGLLVPDVQWRSQYAFLAPDTYSDTYVDVIAGAGVRVELDGAVIGSLRDADGTGVRTATIAIRPGVHRLTSSVPVGAHVYGFGSYTSYLAPAGLDLREVADPL